MQLSAVKGSDHRSLGAELYLARFTASVWCHHSPDSGELCVRTVRS